MKLDVIKQGNSVDVLKTFPDESIDCCITSPPYYGLRDYGMEDQIGLEETPEAYIDKLVEVFREVKRVLKEDGTLWLNIGDSYAGSGKGRNADGSTSVDPLSKQATSKGTTIGKLHKCSDGIAKPKDLIGIPWMLAFALRQDGWYLRQDIIWHKPNPMPEPVKDRCTKSHEYIFLLSKNQHYYFDYKAIQEESKEEYKDRYKYVLFNGKSEGVSRPYKSKNTAGIKEFTGKKNKRDVWTISTKPNHEAHFATFPEELVEPCILAGCSRGGGRT